MRIGIEFNYKNTSARWGDEKYKKLKGFGFDAVDFDMANTENDLYGEFGKEIILREKKMAEDAGIDIYQVHGPWRFPPKDATEEDRAERMEKMKKSLYLTSLIGAKFWVVHPLMPYGIEEIGTDDAEKTWDINISFMRELTEEAKKYDITICYENMPMQKFSLGKPEDILRVVDEINDEHFQVCLDTGHVNVYENVLDLAEEVRRVGDKLKVLHVHDNKCQFDLHMLPYFGWANWEEFAKALSDIKFDGVFSMELVPPQGLPDDLFEYYAKMIYLTAKHISDMI